VLVAVLSGVLLATQGRINGQLGTGLHDGVLAAFGSTLGGLLVLGVVVPATGAGRRGLARVKTALRDSQLRWWQCLGGVCGAFLIIGQGVAITTIGVAVFTVAAVSGQLVSGLLVDRAGIGPSGPKPITTLRVFGALIAVVAVATSLNGQVSRPGSLWLIALPAVAGFGLAWQSAVNGLVRATARNSFVASLVNFTAAGSTLLLAAVIDVVVRGLPAQAPGDWWLWAGGLIGIFVITGSVLAVKAIGVLLLGLCMVAGQLLGAILLDVFVPARDAHLTTTSLIATVITLVAVVVAALPNRGGSERMAA
jgi:transporter family-2 protein